MHSQTTINQILIIKPINTQSNNNQSNSNNQTNQAQSNNNQSNSNNQTNQAQSNNNQSNSNDQTNNAQSNNNQSNTNDQSNKSQSNNSQSDSSNQSDNKNQANNNQSSNTQSNSTMIDQILTEVIAITDSKKVTTLDEVSLAILSGNSVFILDGEKTILVMDTAGGEKRSIEEPQSEASDSWISNGIC